MAYETHSDADNSSLSNRSAIDPILHPPTKASSATHGWLSGWRGLLVGIGLGAAITIVGARITAGPRDAAPAATQTAPIPGQSVSIATAATTQVARTIDATGSVAAFDLLPVLAQANGLQIQQVLVEEGQTVEAGQVIAVLDSSVLAAQRSRAHADVVSAQAVVQQRQATLKQQRATLAEAESNLRRYQSLVNEGAETRQNLEARFTATATAREAVNVAQANIASAQADVQSKAAEVQRLETQLSQTVVRAPASGVIAEKLARVGDVTGATKLFSIIRNGALELQAKVPETLLPQIKLGAAARITSDADRQLKLQGRVREIAPLVDQQTRQATVKISLPPSSRLRSGMFLKSAITVETAQALTVPATAVQPQTDGRSIVYVLEGSETVKAQPVEVGVRQNATDPAKARIEIKSGLNAGDQVVVSGAGYVKDGDRVTVVRE